MSIEVKLPNLGENIESGDIVNVLVHEGDEVQKNQGVVEIETGKATVEIPSPEAGKVTKVHVAQGQTIPVGTILISLDAVAGGGGAKAAPAKPAAAAPAKAEAPAATKAAPAPAAAPAKPAPAPVAEANPAPPSANLVGSNGGAPKPAPAVVEPTGATAPAGPSTRRLARELGVDINRIRGTGPGGRIIREDIVAAVRQSTTHTPTASPRIGHVPEGAESQDKWGTIRTQPLTRIRKTIAANMSLSASTIPHVTNFDDADITELDKIRKGSMQNAVDPKAKLTMMPFVMKAIAQSLRLHPLVNASLDLENGQIIYKDYVNIGVAVDTERGLVVPVVRGVDMMSIPQIAGELAEVAAKARENRFAPDDQIGGTFTISNLGAIGGLYSTPIINPPQVAIILVGRSRKMPVVLEDDSVEPRLMMPLSISYDHRLIDGAAAARFLNDVKTYLQVPGRLLLAQ